MEKVTGSKKKRRWQLHLLDRAVFTSVFIVVVVVITSQSGAASVSLSSSFNDVPVYSVFCLGRNCGVI